MNNKFETLKAGLGNGLICEVNDLNNWNVTIDHVEFSVGDRETWKPLKPHLFPLSHLTKPIRVEGYNNGKDFVPIGLLFDNKLEKSFFVAELMNLKTPHAIIPYLKSWQVKLIERWHFNTEGLDPSDYIDASESKVYEPK